MFGMFLNYYPRLFNGFYYSVNAKDTLEKISRKFKVSVNSLVMANNLVYPYRVNEGDIIFIIGKEEPAPSEESNIYTLRENDNIEKIAKSNDISINKILKDNYLNKEDDLLPGQKLLISKHEDNFDCGSLQEKNCNKENCTKPTAGQRFPELKRGDRGKYVFVLKHLMYAIGYKARNMDSVFDKEFETQIKVMQKAQGFNQTGTADAEIWEYVFDKINQGPNRFI